MMLWGGWGQGDSTGAHVGVLRSSVCACVSYHWIRMCVSARLISAELLNLPGESVPLLCHFSAWRPAQICHKALMEFPVCSFSHDNMAVIFLPPNASDVSDMDYMRFNPVTVGFVRRPTPQ